ncbi:MAG TPA: TonB-dependent receptor [Allosphingosinicella sp.]|nr:TonB-dependent receptor [Allosphingosinicella sp.]
MRRIAQLLAGTTLAFAFPSLALGQEATVPDPTEASDAITTAATSEPEIIVTARKREESLQDVPVAISAITGDTLESRGITSIREAAVLTPGLNINSDGAGRAFVAIRGVGVTLVQSVQPGVGLFIDGIYQPNTSYLNNPIVDVERIEVLRGPQGTLYGKNTLGGAINVISRQPSNEVRVRGMASYAGPDDSWLVSGSISGPIVADKLQVRVAAAHREQEGFLRNSVIGRKANPFNTDTLNATIRARPGGDVTLTINGYYDWVEGVNTPYARVAGPRDYSRNIQFNTLNAVEYRYRGINARLEVPVDGINTRISLIGAYDARDGETADGEGDFGPADIVRSASTEQLRTKTAELRFDSEWSDQFSSLLGLFYSRETTAATNQVRIIPFGITNNAVAATEADTYAAFGTVFWRPNAAWEVAAGLRYDHEQRDATGGAVIGGNVVPIPPAAIESDQVEPRITVTHHWNDRMMSYASVARGYRGGGFNSPLAPIRTYKGDSAWTYELGTKFTSLDRRFSLSGAIFYSDYKDYIGLNSIAPSPAGGLVTVDLNAGDVESYGLELEATFRPARNWTINGGFTWVHARLTDTSPYTAVTGRVLSSDRLTFQPDWNFSLYSDYVVPLGKDRLTFTAGVIGKGSRLAGTLNETTPTILDEYFLLNAQVAYRHGPLELSVFANNLLNEDYFESYIERTTLVLAGLPASDLGIVGDRRRVGIRARLEF